jgi:acyl-CoA reductase-like NAD-dependent aldehyde dehydrogenase
VPGGVVNVLTGRTDEIAPHLARHMDVNAIDLAGVAGSVELAASLEAEAAENVKRVVRAPSSEPDWTVTPDPQRILVFTEVKTVWHPAGR